MESDGPDVDDAADGRTLLVEAEEQFVSAMSFSLASAAFGGELLTGVEFYHDRYRVIFDGIIALQRDGVRADPIGLADTLERRGRLAQVGGLIEVSRILGVALTDANLENHARVIRNHWRRREAIAFHSRRQRAWEDPTAGIEDLIAEERSELESLEAIAPPASPLRSMVSLRDAAGAVQVEKRCIWIGGGMPLGDYGIAHGDGGIGKTRDRMRGVVLRLIRRPWHCWLPSDEPFFPLVISLEIDTHACGSIMRDVAESVGSDVWGEIENKVGILGAPEFLEPLKAGPRATAALIDMIDGASHRLRLDWAGKPANYVLIDSLSEVKEDPSDKPEAYAPCIALFKYVARARNVHPDVIHHDRRLPIGSSGPRDPAENIRGPATFKNASRFACAYDKHNGKRRITWHRVSYGACPADSFYDIDGRGIVVEESAPPTPADVRDTNRQLVLDALQGIERRVGVEKFTGAPKSAIHAAMPVDPKTGKSLSDDTVLRHLQYFERADPPLVRREGEGRSAVYFPITASPHDHRTAGHGDD